jgi:predicted HTH transcriptional regulator
MAPQVATDQMAVPQISQSSPVKISPEKVILALAEKTPALTLRYIMVNTHLEMEDAENAVKKLVAKGMAKEEVDSAGKSTYTFDY